MIRKTSFLNQESPCRPLKTFKVLNEREERRNNVGKTAVVIPQSFRETLGALVRLLSSKLVVYKTVIYLITGVLDSFLNLSRHF